MKKKSMVVAAAALALLAAGGIGWSAIPSGETGVISGCYEKRTGLLRVIDVEAGKACTKYEVALSWDREGPTGEVGPQGIAGPQGEKGEPGADGARGEDGAAGPQGEPGPAGEKGATGDTGPQGADGADGAAGPAGPKGDKGDKGDTGPAGPAGGALQSIDQLEGLACNAENGDAGTVDLAVSGSALSLACKTAPRPYLTVTASGAKHCTPAGPFGELCSYTYRQVYEVDASGATVPLGSWVSELTASGLPTAGGSRQVAPGSTYRFAVAPHSSGVAINAAWTGCDSVTAGVCTVTVDATKTVSLAFTYPQP